MSYPGYRADRIAREPALAPLLRDHDVDPDALPPDATVEYDFDLPEPLLGRSAVVPVADVDLDEPQTRRYAAWMALLDAHRACRLGQEPRTYLERARALVGDQPELRGGCATLVQTLAN